MAHKKKEGVAADGAVTDAQEDAVESASSILSPPSKQARDWIDKISAEWRRATESIIATGRLLLEAKVAMPGEFGAMIEHDLPFGPRTAQRLMAIARHPVIANATHASLLPPSWMTLYELTRLPDDRLLAEIKNGNITPRLERKDVQVWFSEENPGEGVYDDDDDDDGDKIDDGVEPVVVWETKEVRRPAIFYKRKEPKVRLDRSTPTEEVGPELSKIAAETTAIIQKDETHDRHAILTAAWAAAPEADRQRFLNELRGSADEPETQPTAYEAVPQAPRFAQLKEKSLVDDNTPKWWTQQLKVIAAQMAKNMTIKTIGELCALAIDLRKAAQAQKANGSTEASS
jgi:hypothetical protein